MKKHILQKLCFGTPQYFVAIFMNFSLFFMSFENRKVSPPKDCVISSSIFPWVLVFAASGVKKACSDQMKDKYRMHPFNYFTSITKTTKGFVNTKLKLTKQSNARPHSYFVFAFTALVLLGLWICLQMLLHVWECRLEKGWTDSSQT